MAKKPRKNKENKKNYTILIFGILFALLLIFGFFIGKSIKQNRDAKSQNGNFSFYDEEKCRCVERERLTCPKNFELDSEKRACINGTDITNVILTCSKYECSGILYQFNFENKTWETS